ncbi:MAG: carboxylesterase family protein [Acidobacteriota bacterium]|nr:carboxylesterase family protein [Acidobacteriota bacterium]
MKALTRTLLYSTLGICALASPSVAAGQPPRPIRIDSGKILGVLTPDQKVLAYKGIPFALPPVGELRWRAPQPAGRWKKVLLASDFGPHCIQQGSYPDMVFHDPGPSEDCLTLNVWTPSDAKPTKKSPGLPVMVWIYGGGFVTGGTSENRQDGQFLAHRGVVVVSMNYRLGIFGFFTHPELTGESPNQASGNYGLMDQAAAIAWVRRNIAAFGGDPANITIFGESAGSFSVSTLMASPVSKDLFSKAIGESGGALYSSGLGYPPRQEAEQRNVAWADSTFGSSKLFYLRTLRTDEIVKAVTSHTNPVPPFGPVVDGYFLPDSVPNIYAAGKQAHVPTLGGWNANESRPDHVPTADSFTVQAHTDFGPNALKFLAAYPASTDAEAVQSAGDFAGDQFIAFSTWAWLEAQLKTGQAPVYRYWFDLASPGDRNHSAATGAFHSDDIEYVFGTLDSRPDIKLRPEDRALSELMQQYWTNFAKVGDPNGPGLPKWSVYSPEDGYPVMHLDAHPAAAPDALRPRYLFLDSIWGSGAAKQ